MIRQGKQPLFEKSGAKTLFMLAPGVSAACGPISKKYFLRPAIENPKTRGRAANEANVCLCLPKKHVMPAKAGIHDLLAAPRSSAFVTLTAKSWMPAFAGMTGKGAGEGRTPFIRDFSRMKHFFFFKQSSSQHWELP